MPAGRPKHTRNEDKARLIAVLASLKMGIKSIASIVGIADKTLSQYYQDELNTPVELVQDKVRAKIIQKALSGDNEMLKLFAKTQMGWRESQSHEIMGRNGESLQPIINVTIAGKPESDN